MHSEKDIRVGRVYWSALSPAAGSLLAFIAAASGVPVWVRTAIIGGLIAVALPFRQTRFVVPLAFVVFEIAALVAILLVFACILMLAGR
jgi:hypothetical protein